VCQIAVGVVHVVVLRAMLFSTGGGGKAPATFDIDILRRLWRATARTGTLMVIGILLSQIDRVVVSRLLTLESFGYYMLGATIASGIAVVSAPIFNATYPRLSRAAAISTAAVAAEYDRAFRANVGLVVPIGMTAALMSRDMLQLWTGDAAIATAAGPTTTALALGATAIALSLTPTALQLARRDTRALSQIGAAFVLLMAVMVAVTGVWFGALGAAAGWSALAWAYLLAAMLVTHRLGGVIRPTSALALRLAAACVAGSVIVASVMLVLPEATTRLGSALRLGAAAAAAVAGVFLVHNADAQKLALRTRLPTI
jgi:O-antigen/teichoic acid export membrane protein